MGLVPSVGQPVPSGPLASGKTKTGKAVSDPDIGDVAAAVSLTAARSGRRSNSTRTSDGRSSAVQAIVCCLQSIVYCLLSTVYCQ